MNDEPGSTDRYFFIHIQKTAGTSLRSHLLNIFEPSAFYPPTGQSGGMSTYLEAYLNGSLLAALPAQEQARYQIFQGHFPFVASHCLRFPMAAKTFTLLREPVARTLSVLRQKKEQNPEFRRASLSEIYDDSNVFKGQILNHQTKIFSLPPEAPVLSGYAHYEVNRSDLKVAKRNLRKVDVVGLQRDMHTFYLALNNRFGWPLPAQNFRKNVSNKVYFEPELIERITADNAIDIEFYAYAQKLVKKRTLLLRGRRALRRLAGLPASSTRWQQDKGV